MSTVPPEVVDQLHAQMDTVLDGMVNRETGKDYGPAGAAQRGADLTLAYSALPHELVASLLVSAIIRLAQPRPDLPPLITTEETRSLTGEQRVDGEDKA